MTVHPDWEDLKGLKTQDPAIMRRIYRDYYPVIRNHVLQNSGSEEDADDLFQETVIIIYRQVREDRKIDCSLSTYFHSVARLQWLKELRRRKKYSRGEDHRELIENLEDYSPGVSSEIEGSERMAIYQRAFSRLGEDCRKVLSMFYDKISLREIARIMGYASEKYAKKRKFKCKEKLVKMIEADPLYKEWMRNEEF